MATKITAQQLEELKASFKLFDKNGDGKITAMELKEAMAKLGNKMTLKEVQEMIKGVDTDGNGTVEFEEFVTMMSDSLQTDTAEEDLKNAFKTFDKDGDGFITAPELRLAMKQMGEIISEQEAKEMIKNADTDGNNKIDFNEFVAMMKENS